MQKIHIINLLFYVIYIFNISHKNDITIIPQFLLLIIGVIVFLFIGILDMMESDNIENTSLNRNFFEKRKKDFEELENYIKLYNTVGLNGSWGTGKTHIVQKFMFDNKDEYEFIEIDLLTCNLKELQNILVDSLEKIFYSNRIIPKNANKLKQNMESYPFISKIKELLGLVIDSSKYNSEMISDFKLEVCKLDKKILIVFEDLDRIEDINDIKQIFSISEKLSGENIKIIYQYDENILVNEKNINENYLEKYIPFQINLTPMSFFEVIQEELSIGDYKKLNKNDFLYVGKDELYIRLLNLFDLQERSNIDSSKFLNFNFFSIRKINNMIKEIDDFLKREKYKEEYKKIVISYFIIKHLFKKNYNEMRKNIFSSVDEMNFEIIDTDTTNIILVDGREFKKYIEDKSISSKHIDEVLIRNREKILILLLLNYKIGISEVFDRHYSYTNNSINMIVSSMFYRGNKPTTDYEIFVNDFKDKILDQEDFNGKLSEFSIIRNEKTDYNICDIYKNIYGVDKNDSTINYIDIFRVIFDLTKFISSEQKKIDITELIKFYSEFRFEVGGPFLLKSDISQIKTLQVKSKENLKLIMKHFIKFDISHDFTENREIFDLAQKYMSLINDIFKVKSIEDNFNRLLYLEKIYKEDEDLSDEDNFNREKDFEIDEYNNRFIRTKENLSLIKSEIINNEINKVNDKIQLIALKEDLELIVKFIEKIIELFESSNNSPYYESEHSSIYGPVLPYINENLVKEILEEKLNLEQLNEEYKKERIRIAELIEVVDKLPQNK